MRDFITQLSQVFSSEQVAPPAAKNTKSISQLKKSALPPDRGLGLVQLEVDPDQLLQVLHLLAHSLHHCHKMQVEFTVLIKLFLLGLVLNAMKNYFRKLTNVNWGLSRSCQRFLFPFSKLFFLFSNRLVYLIIF